MLLTSLLWGSGLAELALQEGFYQIQAEEGNRNWASSHAGSVWDPSPAAGQPHDLRQFIACSEPGFLKYKTGNIMATS